MNEVADWEAWLAGEFPGFLLPDSMHRSIAPDVAARFLTRLSGPGRLRLLQGTALFAPPEIANNLNAFIHREVPALLEALPSCTAVYARRWEGGFHGRLDVRATLAERLAGTPGTFVTRARQRNFDLPETVLLKQVLGRIARELARLRDANLLPGADWSGPIDECERRIGQLLEGTVLRQVADRAIEMGDIEAARAARGPAYRSAASWYDRLRIAFDEPTATATAALLAHGALAPASVDVRFEIAVTLRLAEALWQRVQEAEPGRWSMSQGLVHSGRKDLATLRRDDGATVEVFYNQAVLPKGPRDMGVEHFFGSVGRLRPDWTVAIEPAGLPRRYVVGEVKHSDNGGYERVGFGEAVLYRFEYAGALSGWLKSVLTVPGALPGKARVGDATIAAGWADWVPSAVVSGCLEGILDEACL